MPITLAPNISTIVAALYPPAPQTAQQVNVTVTLTAPQQFLGSQRMSLTLIPAVTTPTLSLGTQQVTATASLPVTSTSSPSVTFAFPLTMAAGTYLARLSVDGVENRIINLGPPPGIIPPTPPSGPPYAPPYVNFP
jgi:hypothetical protein